MTETTTDTRLRLYAAEREARKTAETSGGRITWDLPELSHAYQRRAVEDATAQATAYVWGRQDAGESARDTGYSIDFGAAYGRRRHLYECQATGFMPNIASAFEQWRDTGTISL